MLKTYLSEMLFRKQREAQTRLHELNTVFWESTLRCNLSCLHCGSDCESSSAIKDMPLEHFLLALDTCSGKIEPHRTFIIVSGGEPLLRKDLPRCGKSFMDRGYPWGMVTNGMLLTERVLSTLLQCGLCSATVSLDGLEHSHDWMRGKSGSFAKALDSISLFTGSSIKVFDVVTCITRKNITELEAMYDLLLSRGVTRWRLFPVIPKGRARGNPDLEITPEMLKRLLDFIVETDSKKKINTQFSCEGFLGAYEGVARKNRFFCKAGIHVSSVLIDGSISACPSLRGDFIQGNIYQDNFYAVWENRFQIMRDRSWMREGECGSCEKYSLCNGNGLHLRDEKTGKLLRCHYAMIRAVSAP